MPIRATVLRALLLLLAAAAAACTSPALPFARLSGLITSPELKEISGLAGSRVHPDVLWAINDSGNPARLHAISRRGKVLARYRVEGARNIDWEDLAAFTLEGRHYLLVADTGDNGGVRRNIALHVFEEPTELTDGVLRPVWTVRARWPDGPRDCEAVAVDAEEGRILLVSKKRTPPELFTLPLGRPRDDAGNDWPEPRRIGRLAHVPQASEELKRTDPVLARHFAQVTAADLSPDRTTLAVLTYGSVLFYRREPGQDWGEAVANRPEAHDVPLIPQAEALAWTAGGGGLYASGEFSPAPLFYLVPER
jgi:hypothetical protein